MGAFETVSQFGRMLANLDAWLKAGATYSVCRDGEPPRVSKITQLFVWRGLKRAEVAEAHAARLPASVRTSGADRCKSVSPAAASCAAANGPSWPPPAAMASGNRASGSDMSVETSAL